MLRLYADRYTACTRMLAGMRAWFNDKPRTPDTDLLLFRNMLVTIKQDFGKLPVSLTLRDSLDRLSRKADVADGTAEHVRILGTLIEELIDNLKSEMGAVLFLGVASKRREFYEQTEPLFGKPVAKKFYLANQDIEAAGQCMALEQWDAAVFHLMRVLEHGLRKFARHLRVKMAVEIDLAQWREIIEAMEAEIDLRLKALGPMKRTASRDKKLTYYSEIASNFRYFKDGWRNHVSHGRATYKEAQADVVFSHVCTFMQLLTVGAPR